MSATDETPRTELLREQSGAIAVELGEIQEDLEEKRLARSTWLEIAPVIRRLLVLLETTVERHLDEADHLVHGSLPGVKEALGPVLRRYEPELCDIRLQTEELRHQVLLAQSRATTTDACGLIDRCEALMILLALHLGHEAELLFPADDRASTRTLDLGV